MAETRHALNVERVAQMISFVQGYGADYAPSNAALSKSQKAKRFLEHAKLKSVIAKHRSQSLGDFSNRFRCFSRRADRSIALPGNTIGQAGMG